MAEPVYVPRWGEVMQECVITRWLRQPGDAVARDEPLVEIETEKMSGEIVAPAAGVLGPWLAQPGDRVPVGEVISAVLAPGETWSPDAVAAWAPEANRPAAPDVGGSAAPEQRAAARIDAAPASGDATAVATDGGLRLSPAAASLARRFGLETAALAGRGAGGRLKREDVLAAMAAALGTPHSEFISIDGQDVHGLRRGQGKPLLLLHGLGGAAVTWEANLTALSRLGDVFAPDLPAHGLTLAGAPASGLDAAAGRLTSGLDALADFAAAVAATVWPGARVAVAGHSLGGAVALRMAARHPGRVERLLLIAPAGLSPRVPAHFARLLWAEPTAENLRGYLEMLFHRPEFVRPEMVELLRRYRALPGRAAAFADLLSRCLAPDGEQRLGPVDLAAASDGSSSGPSGAVGVPTMVAWGSADAVAPPDDGRRAAQAAGARWAEIPGVGHCPHVEAPHAFHRLAEEFLAAVGQP